MNKALNLKVGYLCNNDCIFCVQSDNKPQGNPSFESLKKDLFEAHTTCDNVIFTGGEATIRPDLLELVKYAKSLGFKRFQLQSNVRNLHSFDYCCELINAGINEFAPSLHGYTPEMHDFHTQRPGSFAQTVKALDNLSKLKQYVITNTVITTHNYKYLSNIAELLVSKNVAQIQFANIHPEGNALLNVDSILPRMTDVLPYLFSGLQLALDKNVKCMAEAFPMCLMQEYKKFCSEYFMPKVEVRDTHYVDPEYENTRRFRSKRKSSRCIECVYDNMCEGPWAEYIDKYGDSELVPIHEFGK